MAEKTQFPSPYTLHGGKAAHIQPTLLPERIYDKRTQKSSKQVPESANARRSSNHVIEHELFVTRD